VNAGFNAQAGAKGSNLAKDSNPKASTNSGSNTATTPGGHAAAKTTQSVTPNATATSGEKSPAPVPAAAATNNSDAAATANTDPAAEQQIDQPASAPKTSSNSVKAPNVAKADDTKDDNVTATSAPAGPSTTGGAAIATPTTVGQTQAAADPAQPVAAAITTNVSENIAPATVNGPSASLTVGDQTKARGKLATGTAAAGKDISANDDASAAADTADATAAKEAPSTTQANNTGNIAAGSAEDTTKAQSAQARSAQPTSTQASNDATTTAPQTAGPAPTNSDHAAVQAAQPSPASASENTASAPAAQGAGTSKPGGIDGLPNFGVLTSPATASSTATTLAPSSAASTSGVTIAGLAVAISARAQAGANQFDISLSPPELGRIDVQLTVDGNGQATTHMTVDRPETLQLLQSQQPQLQNALEQAGLTTADNGLQFSLRDQSFTGQNNGSGSQSASTQVVIPEPQLAPVAATQIYTRIGLGSGIDIRV
jgi:flagellar hook-length control protein FliK